MLTLLLTRPQYENTTHYLFYWSKKIIDVAKSKNFRIINLHADRANKISVTNVLKKKNPKLVLLHGHGDHDHITGQNHEVLVKAGENDDLLKKKVVYALSCQTAKTLGPSSIQNGATAYIGYKEDFIFAVDSKYTARPLEDPLAELFLAPSNYISIYLLKGHSVKEACEKSRFEIRKRIQSLVTSNSPDKSVIPYLIWNMTHLTHHGDIDSKVV